MLQNLAADDGSGTSAIVMILTCCPLSNPAARKEQSAVILRTLAAGSAISTYQLPPRSSSVDQDRKESGPSSAEEIADITACHAPFRHPGNAVVHLAA